MITMKFQTIRINDIDIVCDEVKKHEYSNGNICYFFRYENNITATIFFETNQTRKIKTLEEQIKKEGIDILC